MLNMQNVKDIEIPEGSVRTIHDKNSRLIWSRLAYDTKYAGDTLQNGTPTPDAPIPVQVVTGEQTVEVTGKNLFNGTYVKYAIGGGSGHDWFSSGSSRSAVVECKPNTKYTIKKYASSNRFTIADYPSMPPNGTTINSLASDRTKDTLTVTTNADAKYLFIYVSSDGIEPQMQVELGEIATAYEPYQSQTYTIDLGATELCKIGDYQDYIYRDENGDWYLHKATGKMTATSVNLAQYQLNTYNRITRPDNAIKSHPSVVTATSNMGVGVWQDQTWNSPIVGLFTHASGTDWWLGFGRVVTDEEAEEIIGKGCIIYYALATQTNTKITDATLIGQLNAVHQWLTRYGYSATVTGNLPIIINQTNL
jgi:hypothetical protein